MVVEVKENQIFLHVVVVRNPVHVEVVYNDSKNVIGIGIVVNDLVSIEANVKIPMYP